MLVKQKLSYQFLCRPKIHSFASFTLTDSVERSDCKSVSRIEGRHFDSEFNSRGRADGIC